MPSDVIEVMNDKHMPKDSSYECYHPAVNGKTVELKGSAS